MITIKPLARDTLSLVASGKIERADVTRALDQLLTKAEAGNLNLLVEARSPFDVDWSDALAAEVRRLGDMGTVIGALNRVTFIAEAGWLKAAAMVEGALIPGATYRTYDPERSDDARAWALSGVDA